MSLQNLAAPELKAYLTDAWPTWTLALLHQYFIAFKTDVVVRYEMAAESVI